jgi:preprotein translocase subunit SecD
MMDDRGRKAADRRRRILIAVVAAVVGVAITVPLAGALLQQMFGSDASAERDAVSTTTAAPVYTIKPLVVRPVISAEGIAPEACPPAAPVPPGETLRTCDFARTALYTLGPEAVQLQLVRVDSLLSPITNGYIVQVAMTPESATAFADFTQTQIGKQVAFVRAASVVSAPQISESIAGDTLQLSGNLTEQQSQEMARLLRDEA